MPAKNPRLNVVLEPDLYNALSRIAKKEGVSLSLKARDFIRESLELYDDLHWQAEAAKRDATFKSEEALSHDDVWDID